MKKLILSMTIALIAFSCNVENVDLNQRSDKPKKYAARALTPGDPNLDPNWDWTQQSWTMYFNNSSGNIGTINTLNPFIDGSQQVYGNTNVQKADMYPSQGWMLVARDFGTPTNADAYPFLLLYNKYRGTLRVCILRTNDVLSSYQQITLSYASNSSYPNLFKFSTNVLPAIGTENNTYVQTAVTFAGVQKWMIADFDVRGFSSSIPDFSSFNINMSEIAQSQITMSGNIELNGSAQPQAAGVPIAGKVEKVYSFLSSTAEAISKVVESTTPNVSSAMSGGADIFVKSFLKLITGFSGGGEGSTYNIRLKGNTQQSGQITLTSPKASFSVYLKETPNSNAYRALQNIPWGVFNIGNVPILRTNYYPIVTYVPDPNGGPDPVEQYLGTDQEYVFAPNFISNAGFIINPAIANEVSSVEFALVQGDQDGKDVVGPFQPLSQFQSSQTILWQSYKYLGNSLGFAVSIKFNNGSVVYQRLSFSN